MKTQNLKTSFRWRAVPDSHTYLALAHRLHPKQQTSNYLKGKVRWGEVGQNRDGGERHQHSSDHVTEQPTRNHREHGASAGHQLLQKEGDAAKRGRQGFSDEGLQKGKGKLKEWLPDHPIIVM